MGLCACFIFHVQWGCVHASFPMYSGAVCMLHFPCTVGLCACFVSHVQWGCVHALFPMYSGAVCMLLFPGQLGQCACCISCVYWGSVCVAVPHEFVSFWLFIDSLFRELCNGTLCPWVILNRMFDTEWYVTLFSHWVALCSRMVSLWVITCSTSFWQ